MVVFRLLLGRLPRFGPGKTEGLDGARPARRGDGQCSCGFESGADVVVNDFVAAGCDEPDRCILPGSSGCVQADDGAGGGSAASLEFGDGCGAGGVLAACPLLALILFVGVVTAIMLWMVFVELLNGWADDDGGAAATFGAEEDESYEALFAQLEHLLWQRPADPVRALAALMQEWQNPARTVHVAPRWSRKKRANDQDWTPWSGWDGYAPVDRWGRHAASSADDDAGWVEVSRKKAKKPKGRDSQVALFLFLEGGLARIVLRLAAKAMVSWVPSLLCIGARGLLIGSRAPVSLRMSRRSCMIPPSMLLPMSYVKTEEELERYREFGGFWEELRMPGEWRGHVRAANVWAAFCSDNAPRLKQMSVGGFDEERRSPLQGLDPCRDRAHPGFLGMAIVVRGLGGNTATIEGLVRVPSEHACTLLKLSGHYARSERWFVNAVSRQQTLDGVPPLAVDWLDWQEGESWSQYARRARRALADTGFGLAWGMSQLGVGRAATTADAERPRTVFRSWRLTGIPRDWAFEDVETFLGDASFEEVELHERRPWRNGTTCWVFKARAAADYDFFSTVIAEQLVEAVRLGLQARGKARGEETVGHFGDRAAKVSSPPPAASEMQVESGDAPRLDDGKPSAKTDSAEVSKRQKAGCSGPPIPAGMVLKDNTGAGNCMYLLVGVGRSRRSASDLRNVVCKHVRKHALWNMKVCGLATPPTLLALRC
ncbi:CHLP [Symbiodinium sp. CCMP2592]|nr:CHLP [Symbiodinium sp. CCMP2592]